MDVNTSLAKLTPSLYSSSDFGGRVIVSECGLSIIVGKNKETFTGRSESEMFFNPTVAKGSDS